MKVNYVDILLSIAKLLKTNYPTYNIYVDENEQDIKVPSFFIEVSPSSTVGKMDYTKYKTVNLIIEYVDTKAMAQDKLQIIDDLSDLIGKGVSITRSNNSKRTLPVFNIKPTISDIAILLVTLEYFDGISDPIVLQPDRAYDELMGILALNTK